MNNSPKPAGFWPRLMAHNIDLLVLLPIYYGLSFLIGANTPLLIACVVLTYSYEVLFTAFYGGTPGKLATRLTVVGSGGHNLSLWQSLVRSLTKTLTVGTLFIGYLVIILHAQKKGLHDLAVNSLVIFKSSD